MNVDVATATLAEGVTPASQAFSYSVISASPTQYGLFVTISDRLLKAAPTNILTEASEEVGANLALIMDQVVQTEVNAGTNAIYGDKRANRAGITAADTMQADFLRRAVTKLRSRDAKPYDGVFYLCFMHSFQYGDLQENVPNNAWMEWSKYTTPEKLFKGEVGALYGARVMHSSNIQKFNSTVDVYPATMIGKGAYGVTEFANVKSIYQAPGSAGTSDPLEQRATVGAKVDFASKRLNEDAIERVETAVGAY